MSITVDIARILSLPCQSSWLACFTECGSSWSDLDLTKHPSNLVLSIVMLDIVATQKINNSASPYGSIKTRELTALSAVVSVTLIEPSSTGRLVPH